MVYTVAAYHDLGHHIDGKNHEKVSAEMLLADENLREFFSEEEIRIMTEAVYDHRASMEGEPRSIYGKIVSSADRNTDILLPLRRTYSYRISNNPNDSLEKIIEESRKHLINKFGNSGYANEKMYFEDLDYKKFLEDIVELTADKTKFKEEFLKANHLIVKKGDIYKHFKGNIIKVLEIAYDSESPKGDLNKVVVYKQLNREKKTWARPYLMFFEKVNKVKYPEATQEYRFEKISKEEAEKLLSND